MWSRFLELVEPLCAITVPRKLRIHDARLALVQYSLWALVLSYYIYGWISNPRMVQTSEVPVSFANFGFLRGAFNADRNKSWAEFPYCDNSNYNYNPGKSGTEHASLDSQLDGAYWVRICLPLLLLTPRCCFVSERQQYPVQAVHVR
jgi:hypothetical protein